jgi:hypothetical protein
MFLSASVLALCLMGQDVPPAPAGAIPPSTPSTEAPVAPPRGAPPPAASVPDLYSVHKIFIDKMPNDLDLYLRAEFVKQMQRRIVVVLDKNDCDAILTGVMEEEKGTGAKVTGRYLGLHDVATGTVSLLDREGKVLLWSDEAGDRSLLLGPMARGGERKVASRLVTKLKKAMSR